MSHVKIIKLEVKTNPVEVHAEYYSSNIYPIIIYKGKLDYFDRFNGDLDAIELDILSAYESGAFQQSDKKYTNKYTKALARLKKMPEYAEFDWNKVKGGSNERKAFLENIKTKAAEVKALMQKALLEI